MESPPQVIAAASVLKELCYQNKDELQAGFITAGWDRKKGPQVILDTKTVMMIVSPLNMAATVIFSIS